MERPRPTLAEPPPLELPGPEGYRNHFEAFCRECLIVVDKHSRRVPFELNSTQKQILFVIRALRKKGIPPRVIILKARQVGVSTLIEALIFHACLCWRDTSGLVLAHTLKSSKVLFRMSRLFYNRLPSELRQKTRIQNVHEIEFDNQSRMQVEVQGDARGYTSGYVHMSEFAHYLQAEATLVAVNQGVPGIVDSLIALESTARGVGNKFHKVWQRAVGMSLDESIPDDEKGWTPIFIPWWRHEEYRMKIGREGLIPSAEEARMMRDYGLTSEQLKWRRWCISANLDGDEDLFAQEYPATDQEAFARTGRPAFDPRAVEDYTKKVSESVRLKTLPPAQEIESDPPGVGKVEIVSIERGRLRIFATPIERNTYIVGADPSEGDPGSDPSPLAVLHQQSLDLAATWYGKAPPDVLACHAVDLARYYKEGLIINEANNHGILFHETVIQLGYGNLYYRKTTEESVAGEVTLKPGFLSTRRNREYMFNTLRKYVRMRLGKLPCPHFVQQMQSLVYVPRKSGATADAQPGAEKDLLVAFALTLVAHRGSAEAPLVALPADVVRAAGEEYSLLRERDPERAEKFALATTGATGADMEKRLEELAEEDRQRRRFGISSSR